MAAVDAAGFPTRPLSNELIESAWGSAVRDRLIVAAGHGEWILPGNPLNNGQQRLWDQAVPTQAITTRLLTWTTVGMAAATGTAAGSGDAFTTYGAAGAVVSPTFGPIVLAAFAGYYTFMSQHYGLTIPAGEPTAYSVWVNPQATGAQALVKMTTNFLLVAQ